MYVLVVRSVDISVGVDFDCLGKWRRLLLGERLAC